jgi:hypothetical protein
MPDVANRPALSVQLDREWAALRRRRSVLDSVRGWNLIDGPLADLDEVLAATGHRRTGTPAHNAALRRLLDRARTDDLAARIVLQRILPGLLAQVRRRAIRHGTSGLFEELVGSAWTSIRVAFVAPESRHVAAILVNDAAHRAFVAPARRRSSCEFAVDPGTFADRSGGVDVTPVEELAGLVREARERGLASEDLALVRDLMRTESPSALAAERKVTARTIRNHRARAVYSIRRLTDVDPLAGVPPGAPERRGAAA